MWNSDRICAIYDIVCNLWIDERIFKIMTNLIIEQQMLYHLNRAFKKWGIEDTEQKLKEVYKDMPVLREKYLKVYKKLITRRTLNG